MTDAPEQLEFRHAMRPIASSVTVLTTDGSMGRAGVTVSTFCSLSLERPSVIACVHQNSRSLPPILGNGVFAANVLSEEQEMLARVFAGQVPEAGADRFDGSPWGTLTTGAPVLDGVLSAFDCALVEHRPFGSHVILIGDVVETRRRDALPLIYADRAFQRLQAA